MSQGKASIGLAFQRLWHACKYFPDDFQIITPSKKQAADALERHEAIEKMLHLALKARVIYTLTLSTPLIGSDA